MSSPLPGIPWSQVQRRWPDLLREAERMLGCPCPNPVAMFDACVSIFRPGVCRVDSQVAANLKRTVTGDPGDTPDDLGAFVASVVLQVGAVEIGLIQTTWQTWAEHIGLIPKQGANRRQVA